MADVLFAGPGGEPKLPDEVFPMLRWGGQFYYISPNEKRVRDLAARFDGRLGFTLETPVGTMNLTHLGMRIPGITPRGFYFAARKTQLIQPGATTERFTYHVELKPHPSAEHGYVVVKSVPTLEDIIYRLTRKFPDLHPEDVEKRARKLVDHVFPVFLTREAAILQLLERDMPAHLRCRVPQPLDIQKDHNGFVRQLTMNWLRIGGPTLSQMDFAKQSLELLTALHENVRVMHLDLRLDNFVITNDGVGFVDFGSAVRIGEHLEQSPMLNSLFEEMMRTSQIQRMLGKMLERGDVTNQTIAEVHGKVDQTVDAFYLAVQIAKPSGHPELRQLIDYDSKSDEARMLRNLTAAVLRPKNPAMAEFKSAQDILRGVRRIEQKLTAKSAA